jgi:hypothetical protein
MIYNLKSNIEITTITAEDMVKESNGLKKIKPEFVISRFRSMEDLYRYLT